MTLPLDGVEAIDLGTPTPGKYAAFLLAEMGAAVVRVERPDAAGARDRPLSDEDALLNRGKRSLVLDLRHQDGRSVLHRLAARADVLIECYRPGVAERLGAGWSELSGRNPRLVCCSLSGFGRTGPARDVAAYDLVFAGWSGLLAAWYGIEAPRVPGTYPADAISGLTATLAIALALFERERTGRGRQIDLAMLDSAFSLLAVSHGLGPARGPVPSSGSAGASPLYAIYETAGGGRVALAALRPSTSRALLVEIGRPDLAERAQAQDARDEVAAALRDAFRSATAAEWIERLRRHDVEIGPVLDPREAFTDPQLVARGLVEETPIGGGETRPAVTTALRPTWGRSGRPLVAAPRPGQHSDEILRELGYQPAEIERLRDAGTL